MRTILQNLAFAARLLVAVVVVCGCAASEISDRARAPSLPSAWPENADASEVRSDWVASIANEALAELIREALSNNLDLARAREAVVQAREAANMSSALRWPSLSARVDGSRRDTGATLASGDAPALSGSGSDGEVDSFSAQLGINWEVDVLSRLRDDERRAALEFLAREVSYEWTELGIAASVASAYFSHAEAWQLLRLYGRRLENLAANLDIVESGYRQGINEALDVYLARSVLEQQRSQVAQQASLVTESALQLQRLLGRIPDGGLPPGSDLEVVDETIPVGLPSELIARRQDLTEAWFSLLSADAAVAVAHKNRFPRITLVANTSDTTREFDELLHSGNLAWSVSSSLAAPVFDAGRLKAVEQAARSRARQAEQTYMDRIAAAFAEVHRVIDQHASLRRRHAAYEAAAAHGRSAADLSFEQYQKGLTNYVTVLESERRAFDSETTLVRLRAELLRNRVALHRALGGAWEMPSTR